MIKQLSFLPEPEEKVLRPRQWKLTIDGASKNNPGPSGAGF